MDEFIITELQQIPLVKENHFLIKELLTKLFPAVIQACEINVGVRIIRVNNNTSEEPIFSEVKRISYMPKNRNHEYQRASTPYNTMYYGTIVHDFVLKNAIYASAFEVNEFLRENKPGKQTITVSEWIVNKPLRLFSISNEISPVLNYLAYEFSKEVIKTHKEGYMISSIMSEIIVEQKDYDGIIYPSVQTRGTVNTLTKETVNPFCLALSPMVIDEEKVTPILASQHNVSVDENGFANLSIALNHCVIEKGQTELFFIK